MNPYYFSFSVAALAFPVIASFIAVPYAVYSYRKYGAISVWRTFVLASFALYLQCAYFVVILPLPDPAALINRPGAGYNLIPFAFVYEFLTESSFVPSQISTWLPALKSGMILHAFLNYFLLFPFGIYLSYYFQCNWKKVLLFSFLFSLFFEITQLTALYGLYPKPYRVFDVDDLISNTVGAMLGYFVYVRYLRFLPGKDRADQKSLEKSAHVGYLRRWVAFTVDYMIVSFAGNLMGTLFVLDTLYSTAIALSVYSIGVSLLTGGRTAGKALVRITVAPSKAGLSFALLIIIRYLGRNGLLFAFSMLENIIRMPDVSLLPWLVLYFAMILFLFIDFSYSLLWKKDLWYGRLSRTENVSTFKDIQRKIGREASP